MNTSDYEETYLERKCGREYNSQFSYVYANKRLRST
jgi:hypothetical protein